MSFAFNSRNPEKPIVSFSALSLLVGKYEAHLLYKKPVPQIPELLVTDQWRLGLVAVQGLNQRSYSTPGPVSTGMGDRLWAGKPPRFVTSHSGQLRLLPSVK